MDLAQTGQLLESDEVREGADGEWCAVRDRHGLLDGPNSFTPAAIADEPQSSDSGSALVAAIPKNATVEQESVHSSSQPDATPVAQSLAEFEAVAGRSIQTCKTREASRTDLPSPDELDFELNLPESSATDPADSVSSEDTTKRATGPKPIPDQTNELDFKLNLPLQHPAARSETAGPESFTDPPPIPTRANSRTSSFEPAKSGQTPSPDDLAAPPIVSELPQAPSTSEAAEYEAATVESNDSEPVARRRVAWASVPRLLRRAGTVAFVLCLVWWLLPGPETDIYADYVAIHQELQNRRLNPDGQVGWSEFVDRSRARIDEANAWLEETARPGDRKKNLLLYAGRDMQKMLEHSPDAASPHQQRLGGFFEQLAEIYEPVP